MRVTIDKAGRVVVPKPIREQLGFTPDTPLDIDVVDNHLEIYARREPPRVVDGPNGPVIAATGVTIDDDDVRALLESVRQHR